MPEMFHLYAQTASALHAANITGLSSSIYSQQRKCLAGYFCRFIILQLWTSSSLPSELVLLAERLMWTWKPSDVSTKENYRSRQVKARGKLLFFLFRAL